MLEPILEFFAAAVEALPDAGGILPEGGAFDRVVDAIRQLFLWFDLLESDDFNQLLNIVLGIIEALGGAVLISMGLPQLNLVDSIDGEELTRVTQRTAGEVVKTLLGHLLRLVGIVRGLAGLVFLVASQL